MNGEKPAVREIGPYVYLQKRRKFITHIDKNVVTYKAYKSYHFVPEYSNGIPDDKLYALNVPMVAMDKLVGAKLPGDLAKSLLQPILEGLIDKHQEKLVVERKVSEMLFDGYPIPMLTEVSKLAAAFMPDAKLPAADRFGLFYNTNDTADQLFTVGTGAGDYPFATILKWNNLTSLNFWGSEYCNKINGTDGAQFSPFIETNQKLFVFATDLCRSIYFEFEKPTQVKGVDTKRFTVPDAVFASATQRAENRCFCEGSGRCHEGGVIPLSSCRRGAPIMLSAPHFYQGDAKLVQDVEGLRPEKKNHETFLDVQTMTGLVLRAAKRLQINIDLKQSDLLYPLANLTSRVMPIAWVEERMEATRSMTEALTQRLIQPQKMGVMASSAAVLGGAIGAIAALLVIVVRQANTSRSAKLQPSK
ncbi:lysosome membrane protein 2-like [Tropilaelaps mercedesae]|uniref:Lysosome membrane protein 2-like n=1 Tax=Tropilaelaps mercedesae TaxID=418985 RepID=A0A1V9WZC0_9ACAR|nr:lysosome membrane protein 2-like [Tropilaelaps mercedesae]